VETSSLLVPLSPSSSLLTTAPPPDVYLHLTLEKNEFGCKGLVQQFPFCSIFYRLPTLYQLPERLEKRRGGRKGKIKGRRKVL